MICPSCGASNAAAQSFCGRCGAALTETKTGYDVSERLDKVLGGKYRLKSLVGQGASGAVYQAECIDLGTTVAIKVLHPHISVNAEARQRLENEARLASRIDHPNVVSILDLYMSTELTYLVMEYLSGISLDEALAEVGYLGVRRSIHIVRQLLSALEASHGFGVLHRDLKPDNIYLTLRQDRLDFIKVLDFGIAKLAHEESSSRITNDGVICGTPGYMSPEQVRNLELCEQSDLYSVGILLYECLTGVNPFLGKGATDTMVNQVIRTPKPPSKVRKGEKIPPYLDALVMRALAKEPSDRFGSANEFRTVLESFVLAQGAKTVDERRRTCAQCGNTVSSGSESCEACGEPAGPQLEPWASGQGPGLAPEQIGGGSVESRELKEELSLSTTTTIGGYRSVRWDPPLLGRSREMEQLEAFMEPGPTPHRPRMIRLVGGIGMGKGRLVREVVGRLEQHQGSDIWCEPRPFPAPVSLEPIQRVAATLLELRCAPLDREGLLAAAESAGVDHSHHQGLLELFALAGAADDSIKEQRARRANAWREVVRCAARRGPLRLLVQDLQLFDAPSQDLITALGAMEHTDNPVRVLVTHDPHLALLWPRTEIMMVPALSSESARMLVESLLAQVGIRCDVEDILQASGGCSLMLIERVRLAAIDPSIQLPRTLAEVINQRISHLPPKARMLLRIMVVLGRPTDAESLISLLHKDQSVQQHALSFLVNQGFLRRSSEGYRLSHAVHHQVALASMPVSVRHQLNVRAVQLAQRTGAPDAHLAHFLIHAAQGDQAVPYLLSAGKQALFFLDDTLAREIFDRLLTLVPAPPALFQGSREVWITAILGLSNAMRLGGEINKAVRLLRQAVERVDQAGWKEEKALLLKHRQRLQTDSPRS